MLSDKIVTSLVPSGNIIKQLYPKSKQIGLIKQMLDKYIGSTNIVTPTVDSPTKKLMTKQKKLAEHIKKILDGETF